MQASRALKEAADTIMESPAALQLRYLQTLGIVAAEKESTILFPLPIDMMGTFMNGKGNVSKKHKKSKSKSKEKLPPLDSDKLYPVVKEEKQAPPVVQGSDIPPAPEQKLNGLPPSTQDGMMFESKPKPDVDQSLPSVETPPPPVEREITVESMRL